MSSSMQLYGITITNLFSNSAPADGFIDTATTEDYYGANGAYNGLETVPSGSTLITTTSKRRSNLRFQHLLQTVQLMGNCYVIPNSVVSDATPVAEASAFSFQLIVEHGPNSLQTTDETAPGTTLVGTAALVRALARGLSTPYVTASYVFDSTGIGTIGPNAAILAPRFGDRIGGPGSFVVGKYAANLAAAVTCIAVVPLLPVSN